MNRTAFVFTVAMAFASQVFAVDLTNTNLVGADGLPGKDGYTFAINANGPHQISGSSFTGGNATSTTATTNTTSVSGGSGISAGLIVPVINNWNISVDSTVMQGGQGGNIAIAGSLTANATAEGGRGFTTSKGRLTMSDSSAYGGDGGSVTASGGAFAVSVAGGHGIYVNNGLLSLDNVDAAGGNGGSAVTSGASSSSASGGSGATLETSTLVNRIADSELTGGNGGSFNNGTGVAVADGGAGFSVSGVSGSLVISNSTLTGGSGGTAVGSTASTAKGGAGLKLVTAASVKIVDSVLTGGSGGTVNGAAGANGAGLEIQGSTVELSGGQLAGDLLFSGTGTSTLSIQGTTIDGALRQTGGTANLNAWDAGQFKSATISDGTMNFNNQAFNLDGMFALKAATAKANFNAGLTVADGGSLNLGLGTVGASSVVLESGSVVESSYNGTTLGKIASTGTLTLDSGSKWIINAGSSAVALGKTFDIATATGSITTNITAADIKFVGTGGVAGWLGGINTLQIAGNILRATYGQAPIDVALGVDGDTSTEFGKAMSDLSTLVVPGSDAYNSIAALASSPEVGAELMTNGYVRTTEMASALVGLQSIFADQIKDRTRSQLQFDAENQAEAMTPAGAEGWTWMRNRADVWEQRYGYDELKTAVDMAMPTVRVDNTTLPESWQVWGRGYGSYIEQDTNEGFAGYDSTIGGGLLGVDKRINNTLLGIGAGYARTDLQGYDGRDGLGDTLHGTAYFSTHGEHLYLDANATYAFNDVETGFDDLGYEGDYSAHTVGLYVGAGYGISLADFIMLTPEASILDTYYTRDSYTESSTIAGMPALDWDSYDQWSLLSQVGATLSMVQRIDINRIEMGFRPELRVHWLHDFNNEMDDETYMMVGGSQEIGASLMAREEDLVKVGAGVRFSNWASDKTEIGIDVDGTFGDNYDGYIVSGKIMHRF